MEINLEACFVVLCDILLTDYIEFYIIVVLYSTIITVSHNSQVLGFILTFSIFNLIIITNIGTNCYDLFYFIGRFLVIYFS